MNVPPNPGATLGELSPDFNSSDPYQVLGVARTATQAEIKRSYFALIRQYPPETQAETFKLIRGAYEQVKDATRRKETDIFLPQPPPPFTLGFKATFETKLQRDDVLTVLQNWGDLGRTDFETDFSEINL